MVDARAQGFGASDIAAMRGVLGPLALVFRIAIKDQITRNALNTFHGPLVGGRILSGTIKRGDGERLAAALWYSDLRNSTGLADQLPVDAFLDLLDAFFDCAAGAVMEQGGQVLDIIGDAILAFFPAGDNGGTEACSLALEAAAGARDRLAELKREGSGKARAIEFGIGVHFGDVVFGNAGTPERLKFGVLGRAVNEVARTADMAKSLKRPVVVSDEVARRSTHSLADLGLHELRGIPVPDIAASIVASGIADVPVAMLVEGAMRRLMGVGVPLHRMNVSFRILHPLFDGMSITWTEEGGVEVTYSVLIDQEGSLFLSPFYFMLTNGLTEFRCKLVAEPAVDRFPLLAELRSKGFTDYLALIVSFGGAPLPPPTRMRGSARRGRRGRLQVSARADIAAMRQVLAPLALALRVIKDQITRNALNTFHGTWSAGDPVGHHQARRWRAADRGALVQRFAQLHGAG